MRAVRVSIALLRSFRKGPYRSGGSNAVSVRCDVAAKQDCRILGNFWSNIFFGEKIWKT